MKGRQKEIHRFLGVLLAVGLMVPGGCATKNYRAAYADEMISRGERTIKEARAANAEKNAPAALTDAEEKLSLAKAAFAKEDHEDAANLAEEAVVTAEYAQARSTTEESRKTMEEMEKNIEVLKKEVGAKPE